MRGPARRLGRAKSLARRARARRPDRRRCERSWRGGNFAHVEVICAPFFARGARIPMTSHRFKHRPTRADLEALLRLAAPFVLIQVGAMLMGVVDTIMVGRVSAQALAAVALGNLYHFVFAIFGMGVLMALDPIIAQALGARDELAVARGLQRGLVLSVVLAIPTSLLMLTARPVLEWVGQPAPVIPDAVGYIARLIPSVWPFFAFVVLRQTLQAHRRTAPIVLTIVVANLLNVGLNYLWIYGKLGFAPLGVLGSAWATTTSRWFMAAMVLALGWRDVRVYLARRAPNLLDPRALGRMLKLGAPIGAQMVLQIR